MSRFQCYPIDDPNAQWLYCPSYTAAIIFCSLFGLTMSTHIFQGFYYRRPFTVVIIMAGTWEFLGYIFRILSTEWQLNESFATAQQLLILLAPLWINAFVYMVLGRMVHFYLPDDCVFNIKARRITTMFVLFDIFSFIVQAAGGVMTSNSNPPVIQKDGLHVYMGGVGLQLVFICVFISLAIRFQQKLTLLERSADFCIPESDLKNPRHARRLLYVIYAVLLLIIYRNIYRLIEFSSGVESSITTHEWFAYVFDAVPMFFALVIFNACHPSRVLVGTNSDFSEQKSEKKEAKRAKKMAKKIDKDTKMRVKLLARLEKKQQKKSVKEYGKVEGGEEMRLV